MSHIRYQACVSRSAEIDLKEDVYEVLLGIEAVSHYAAFEIGRGTRHGREACRDGTARAAFRRGKGLDAVGQEFMHPLLGLLTHAGCEGEECTDG